MKYTAYLFAFLFLSSCIGDDVIDDRVPEEIVITNAIDSLQIGDTYQFEADYFDNIGRRTTADIIWTSSNESVMSITPSGLATGLSDGMTTVEANVNGDGQQVIASHDVVISLAETSVSEDERPGSISTTSSYRLEGDFVLAKDGDDLKLSLASNFVTTSALPGLYVYLGNNPNSISGALEISKVTQFDGAHDYIISGTELFDYQYILFWCKPFGVKVGQGDFQ